MAETEEQRAGYIRALLEEKAGYERTGQLDRAAEVQAQLVAMGAAGEPPTKRATRRRLKA